MTWDNKFNKNKWKIVDSTGKEFGRFRERKNALDEIKKLKKELWIDTILENIE